MDEGRVVGCREVHFGVFADKGIQGSWELYGEVESDGDMTKMIFKRSK